MNTRATPAAVAPQRPLPRVQAALHTRIVAPFGGHASTAPQRMGWLADEVCAQLDEVRATTPEAHWNHILCTTCLSPMLTGWPQHAEGFSARIASHSGIRPLALLQAYQCAGWGYALRFAGQQAGAQRLAISIVDADIHEAVSSAYVAAIGRIGFGITTLGLELPAGAALPRCGGPFPNRAFNEFLHAVKASHRERGRVPTFIPFLPEGFAGVAERMIGTDNLWPNRHEDYGHTFGADPWIGLIEWCRAHPSAESRDVTLGAFAYHGYFTLCSFEVPASIQLALRDWGGEADQLRRDAETAGEPAAMVEACA
ncbi:hypothetical protein [Ideonella sp.]|uniref:hypothetical protein n=1 Tax=Ideonella sp. TaxID=1929293 RepID=UPI0035B09824